MENGKWRAENDAGWEVVDAKTGKAAYVSPTPPAHRVGDGTTKEGVPFIGEETYEMDFSSVTNEGTYFVRIPGVGRSADFRIAASAAEEAFRVHMLGLYQKRCGIAKAEPYTHWTAGACHAKVVRGTFPPEEGKLEPKVKWFEIIRDNTDWKGERLDVVGGWHDAADYDRRPMHLNIVNDLCAVYLMKPENFYDGQLAIHERGNGIPDVLDEAEWGLRHLLAVQQKDGGVGTWIETTRHPSPGNVAEKDDMPYAVSRATRRSSLMYAAHAALLARCRPEFREKYAESAKRAWAFALSAPRQSATFSIRREKGRFLGKRTENVVVRWTEDEDLPVEYLLKAAVNLHSLTDDASYLAPIEGDAKNLSEKLAKKTWNLIPLLYAGERALGLPGSLCAIFRKWEKAKINAAKGICEQVEGAYAYRAPWWPPQKGWCHAMGFGHSHPLVRAQSLLAAYQISGEKRCLDAISLAADFHNGCNPQGTTLTSGLGEVYPVAFLDLPSYVDGIAEYVPGITPYRWTYAMPKGAVDMVWGGDRQKASKWPIWRRWGNLEGQTVAASEYTVWETIAPAASVMGYLISPNAASPLKPRPAPASRLSDLPGYWLLP